MLKTFKELPLGYNRLIIVGWIFLPLLFASIGASLNDQEPEQIFFNIMVFGIPIYYILARLGIWIYKGFKNQ